MQTKPCRMKPLFGNVLRSCLVLGALLLVQSSAILADESDIQYEFGAYGWLPDLTATPNGGEETIIGMSDLIEDLDGAAMLDFAAKMDRFTFSIDAIYFDIEEDTSGSKAQGDVELKAVVLTPKLGYAVLEGEEGRLELTAGARMLYLDAEVGATIGSMPSEKISGSNYTWDAIFGMRGRLNLLAENWYVPALFDVGAGDSNLTYHVFGGIGYEFEDWNVTGGYRYLDWDLGSNSKVLDELTVAGPQVGALYKF